MHAQLGALYSMQHETSSKGLSSLLRAFTLRSDYEVNIHRWSRQRQNAGLLPDTSEGVSNLRCHLEKE